MTSTDRKRRREPISKESNRTVFLLALKKLAAVGKA